MMNRGLMRRQMFAMGGPVRMEEGGLASLQAEANRLGITVAELLSRMQSDNRRMSVFEMEKMQKFRDRLREEMDRPSPPTAQGLPQRPIKLKEGGSAGPPDVTRPGGGPPDGKFTQADLLKLRGVELKQYGGSVGMQMGGEPMMAQQAAMMQAPIPQAPMPQDPSMDQAMAQAAQVGVDPAAVEGMLSQVSEGIGNLDDAEDFEQVMNSMRGDEAPISERYAELAEVVGEEDAQATPESVLALVQPVMQIAQVDQGIGGLAQEEMSAPVEGNMAGGIMSTVNMGEEVPTPVNFNQGGPVVAMAPGGVVERATSLQPGFQEMFGNILGTPEQRQAEFDEQKRLTQAQMLFDIANTALAFATPGQRQMSPAERLAAVTQETQLFDKIGARSQSLQDLKTKQKEAQRQLDLASTQAALSEASAQQRAQEAINLAEAKKKPEYDIKTVTTGEGIKIVVTDKNTGISKVTETFAGEDKNLFSTDVVETGGEIKVLVTNKETGDVTVKKTFDAPKDKPDNQPVYGFATDGRPTILGYVDMNLESGEVLKARKALSDKSLNQQLLTKEQYESEIRLNEYFQKGAPGQDRVVLTDIEIEGPDGLKRTHEAGEIVRLNERQLSKLQGKTNPYEKRDYTTIYSKDEIKTFVNTEEGKNRLEELLASGDWSMSSSLFDANIAEQAAQLKEENLRSRPVTKIEDGNLVEIVKDKEGRVVSFKVLGPVRDKDLFNKSAAGLALKYFNSKNADGEFKIDLYAQNKLNEEETRIMESQITAYTTPESTVAGTRVAALPSFVEDALVERVKRGIQVPVPLNSLPLPTELAESLGLRKDLTLPFGEDGKIDYSQFEDMPSIIIGDVDLTNAQGFMSGFKRIGNWFAGQFAEIGIGDGVFGESGERTLVATKQLAALKRETINSLRAAIDGKVFKLDLDLLTEETQGFQGSAGNTDANALATLETVRNTLASKYNATVGKLEYSAKDPSAFSEEEVEAAKKAKGDLERLLGEYTAAIMSYRYAKAKSSGTGIKKKRPRKSETGTK